MSNDFHTCFNCGKQTRNVISYKMEKGDGEILYCEACHNEVLMYIDIENDQKTIVWVVKWYEARGGDCDEGEQIYGYYSSEQRANKTRDRLVKKIMKDPAAFHIFHIEDVEVWCDKIIVDEYYDEEDENG